MQKQVPVFYDDKLIPDLFATVTLESTHQDWTINVMEIMRLTSFLRAHVPGFSGIQKSQVPKNEDRVVLYSSV